MYESLRRRGAKDGVLCSRGITSSGTKVLLGLTVGANVDLPFSHGHVVALITPRTLFTG